MKPRISRLLFLAIAGCLMLSQVHAEESQSATKNPADQVRQILMQAAGRAVPIASQENAYYGNKNLRIPFPQDLSNVQSQMTRAGEATAAQVTKAVELMNAAADEAAKSALPLLQQAITDLKIDDAATILSGDSHPAADYFREHTKSLKYSYKPIVKAAMKKVGLQNVWEPLLEMYSDLAENDPVVTQNGKENVLEGFDLNFYISERAMNGLYVLMAAEEAKISAKH